MSRISIKKKLVFSLLVLVMVLGTAELVLRAHDFDWYVNVSADIIGMPLLDMTSRRRVANQTVEFDRVLFWKFKPDQVLSDPRTYRKPVRINNHGFRGPDIDIAKPQGVIRVACLGDSSTFGWSVGDDEHYGYYLQNILSEKYPDNNFQVLNFGVTGYTSYQGRELMKSVVRKYYPDIVVFAFGANDRWPALRSDEEQCERGTWDVSSAQLLLRQIQLYQLMRGGVAYLGNRTRGQSLDPASYISKIKRKVDQQQFSTNVRAVHGICMELEARLILVNMDFPAGPMDPSDATIRKEVAKAGSNMPEGWSFWDSSELARELERELDISGLDVRAMFADKLDEISQGRERVRAAEQEARLSDTLVEEPWRYLMIDQGHPNAWGHELIAVALSALVLDPLPEENP